MHLSTYRDIHSDADLAAFIKYLAVSTKPNWPEASAVLAILSGALLEGPEVVRDLVLYLKPFVDARRVEMEQPTV